MIRVPWCQYRQMACCTHWEHMGRKKHVIYEGHSIAVLHDWLNFFLILISKIMTLLYCTKMCVCVIKRCAINSIEVWLNLNLTFVLTVYFWKEVRSNLLCTLRFFIYKASVILSEKKETHNYCEQDKAYAIDCKVGVQRLSNTNRYINSHWLAER